MGRPVPLGSQPGEPGNRPGVLPVGIRSAGDAAGGGGGGGGGFRVGRVKQHADGASRKAKDMERREQAGYTGSAGGGGHERALDLIRLRHHDGPLRVDVLLCGTQRGLRLLWDELAEKRFTLSSFAISNCCFSSRTLWLKGAVNV